MYGLQEWAAVQRVYIRCIETMTEEAEGRVAGQKKAQENEEETKRKNKTGHSESDKGSHADTSPRCVSGQKEV